MADGTLLLVEDDADEEELILRALKKSGIKNEIAVVRDGTEALDYLFGMGAYAGRNLSVLPALVLLDLNLPKVGGLEVLERLRGDARTRLLPVVILTSSGEEKDIAACYRLGVNSYVLKQVDSARFAGTIGLLGTYWLLLNEPPRQG
ncbi:MAG: response regulator [Elusimicrobiota bacterium]|nr:response regulator [Elusimicrobiota bacterium]